MDVHDILASDVKIVDASLRQAGDGTTALGFPEHLMPDGRPFAITFNEQLSPTVLRVWCERVRGEWNARQNRKEAEEISRAAISGAGGVGNHPGPDQSDSGGAGAASDGEAREASLEDSLKSEVARWADRERKAAEEVAALEDRLAEARAKLDAARASRSRACRVLAFYEREEKEEL